ncbi:hypothetical protein QCA50_001953 [Cerrena zonata]|uniref:Nucleoporin n=1 Tax=Cerrena zonata TaxID=2478898 RepID=A0AAW0GY41_9APHY
MSRMNGVSFAHNSLAKTGHPQPAPGPPPLLDLPGLQAASKVLQEQFAKDAQAVPELGEMLAGSGQSFSALYSVFPDDYRTPFQKKRLVPIPESLFQHYNTTSVTTHMGLMPELDRVWISIDHNLFLWDYVEGQELSSFVDQPDVISHVTLVKPKPNVFIDDITYLLVLCTPISVVLIGVSIADVPGPSNRSRKEIKLYATDMSVNCDVEMLSVAGTEDGRIFMCGAQDGNLYELHYQEKEGWFGKRVQLINHSIGGVQSLLPRFSSTQTEDRIVSLVSDVHRNCFYTLTASNSISVWRTNGDKSIQHVQTLSNLYKLAQDKAPGTPALTPATFSIFSLHVLEPGRSQSSAHLMAITANGVRLFIGSTMGSFNRQLQVVHVRLPPPNLIHPDEQASPFRPQITGYGLGRQPQPTPSRPYILNGLDISCYDAGLIVAAQPGDTDTTDFLLCLSPDLSRVGNLGQVHGPQVQQQPTYPNMYGATQGPGRPVLTENATLIPVPGRTWAMAAVTRPSSTVASTPPDCPAPVIINELATQFSEPTRQFMILTNAGLTFMAKRRALDSLKEVIEELHVNGNYQPLIEFRDSFGRDQTCAMLLAIACENTFVDATGQTNFSPVSPEIASVARQVFYDFGERPIWAERTTYGTTEGTGSTTYSGRREGLALYFARLVRPFWKAKLMKPGPFGFAVSNISDDTMTLVQKNLESVKRFFETNHGFFSAGSGDHAGARLNPEQEALKAEKHSADLLIALLKRTIEAISFFILLVDHNIGELIEQCEPDVKKSIQNLTFEQLVIEQGGVAVARALVNVLINQQIGQQLGVEAISNTLQLRCSTFCSSDDVMLYKAREAVRKAAETKNPLERQECLSNSLQLFIQGARILEFEKLREIVGDYQQLNYAKGAVELPLHCAEVLDSDSHGREYWYNGSPTNDPRAEAWKRRSNCYDLILDSLQVFEDRCDKTNGASPSTYDDPETVKTHAYDLAFSADDEMFHSTLYDWLISRNIADELLEMRPAYLEAYLRRDPVTEQKYQLLWQFYVKDGQPLRAAEVLGALAESTEFDLSLDGRLEALTLAVSNAKSQPVAVGGRHETALAFLSELEEKLDVLQVQRELFNTIKHRAQEAGEVGTKVKLLSKGLLTVTEMWQFYADPLDLPFTKLSLLNVSETRDDNLVRPIWNRIFEEAMEDAAPEVSADRITSQVVKLGQRYYPSEFAFPLRHVSSLLVRFALANKDTVPYGWAPRILVRCGVPHAEVWDILHEMYESQIPPFNEQSNVQQVSSDIAVLITDWLEEVRRPQSPASRMEFPVYRIDQAVDQYLSELESNRLDTKSQYENIKRQLRRNW